MAAITCLVCGAAAEIGEVKRNLDVINGCKKHGWRHVMDYRNNRIAVFCSEPCLKKGQSKSGRVTV